MTFNRKDWKDGENKMNRKYKHREIDPEEVIRRAEDSSYLTDSDVESGRETYRPKEINPMQNRISAFRGFSGKPFSRSP